MCALETHKIQELMLQQIFVLVLCI